MSTRKEVKEAQERLDQSIDKASEIRTELAAARDEVKILQGLLHAAEEVVTDCAIELNKAKAKQAPSN